MKHIMETLLASGVYELSNIPNISSIHNLLKVIEIQGASYHWIDEHSVIIDTTKVQEPHIIPPDLYFHTSAAVSLNTGMTGRFGYFQVDTAGRNDSGGDQIGRVRPEFNSTAFSKIGIAIENTNELVTYKEMNKKPFTIDVKGSHGITAGFVRAALFKKGTSTIHNACIAPEILNNIEFLRAMGASVSIENTDIIIEGGKELHSANFTTMYDKNDFISFLIAALITESEITIHNVDYKKMGLEALEDAITQMNIKLSYDSTKKLCHVFKNKLIELKPIKIVAKEYPHFSSDWQPIFSSLLALIEGNSEVIEGYHLNRLRHWEELKKMGADYKFIQNPEYPEKDGNPRVVEINGVKQLTAATVNSKDVRGGAAMILAGLAVNGQTTVLDPEDHIIRGYEHLAERLNSLGAEIATSPSCNEEQSNSPQSSRLKS
jgi:UDP-N-acetylglucosamine 1-carboxyvinyltransferase